MGPALRRSLLLIMLLGAAIALGSWLKPEKPASEPMGVETFGSVDTRSPATASVEGDSQASLLAARNEFESFFIEVVASGESLTGLRAKPSNLVGPDGARIPTRHVSVYRAASLEISPETVSDSEGAPGPWPDALIPERDAFYGEDRAAFPVDLDQGDVARVWVDVFVPPGTPPGKYRGKVAIAAEEAEAKVPVRVRVIRATLPSTSSLRSAYLIYPETVCAAHAGTDCTDPALGPDGAWPLLHLYARAALENRTTISNPLPNRSAPRRRKLDLFDRFVVPLLSGTPLACEPDQHDACVLPSKLAGARLTSFSIEGAAYDDPATDPAYGCVEAPGCLSRWRRLAEKRDFDERAFVYLCDEPEGALDADGDGSAVEEIDLRWEACSEAARRVRSVEFGWPSVQTLLTGWRETAEPRGALDYTDIMTVAIDNMADRPDSPKEDAAVVGDQRAEYESFLAGPGGSANELWLYAYCWQFSCDGSDDAYWEGWAGYGIDQPASQARAMSWLAYLYGAGGELYYSTTLSLDTAWTDQYEFGGNGDGNLFYPGEPDGGEDAGTPAIGGEHPIPIESIRLKRIRDGREDYELLNLLSERGAGQGAEEVAAALFGSASAEEARETATFKSTFSQADVDAARCRLASLVDPASDLECP